MENPFETDNSENKFDKIAYDQEAEGIKISKEKAVAGVLLFWFSLAPPKMDP